jgi:hypothetical protein
MWPLRTDGSTRQDHCENLRQVDPDNPGNFQANTRRKNVDDHANGVTLITTQPESVESKGPAANGIAHFAIVQD